jgi:PIN domain nuclease of toxin-antitoxin system
VTVVLDASAVPALIYREAGHDRVAARLPGAVVSAVNWSEVVAKPAQRGHPDPASAAEAVRALGIEVAAFSLPQAVRAGLLWPITRAAGLSLADRACLALAAADPASTTLTGDRVWAELPIDTTVELIR